MNKYQNQSTARLCDNLIDPIDVLDEMHKESLEHRAEKIARIFSVARQMFELLNASDLKAEDRATALALLNVLQNRLGNK